jgi:hypothetical protein
MEFGSDLYYLTFSGESRLRQTTRAVGPQEEFPI